jgi:pSer/pThr/pTyr-binding forkhead associated (FHA) protein/uncharacterized RDD family membrane protein YckC
VSTSGWQVFVEVPGKAPIELADGEAVIGRSRAAAVQIAESTVSRQHAVFVVEPGKVVLKDLGSSNGTYVNGKRVDGSIGLADGDKVVVGEAELVVRILAPLGPAEATQKLTLPPMTAPAPPGMDFGAASEPPPSFRRTPTDVPGVADLPVPPRPPAPPPLPPPPVPAARPATVAPPPPTAPPPKTAPAKPAEVLSSIGDLDAMPLPPASQRPTQVAARPAASPGTWAPAGFWIRVAASLLDAIPVLLLAAVGFALAFYVMPELGLLFSLVQLAYGLALVVVFPALKGTTPGKKLLKLAIVSETTTPGQGLGWGTALLRFVGHMVCSLTFSLGYLLVAFTAQKQGLHDLIAKTHVVRKK